MKLIAHRRNTSELLLATPREYGIEVDIRSLGERMIIHHDAFKPGEDFESWVANYSHGTLILNVKEEGLEERLIRCMSERGIADYFFLDQSFPFLIKTSRQGESRCAVRVSEFESIDTALTLAGKIDWVWIDCFTRFPLDREGWLRLTAAGFRLCLVSPELQGRFDEAEIREWKAQFRAWGVTPDAVCTKLELMQVWTRAD
jgi:hypothetical protein